MKFLNDWWGINENISPLETAARAAVMFLIALVLIRLSGMRPFGKDNASDTVIAFLIGGILCRGVVGATPFFSTVAGAVAIILVHKAFSKFSFYSSRIERSIKGKSYLLYKNGDFIEKNMKKANVTETDIYEELRLERHKDTLEKIKEVYLEKTGEISFVEKEA
jgi:uncharacterized membrane protein YcaP (DUF421 family)